MPEWRYYVYALFVLRSGERLVFYVGGAWREKDYGRLNDHSAASGAKWCQQFITTHPDEEVHREVYAYCADQTTVRALEPLAWDEFRVDGHPVQPERPSTITEEGVKRSLETRSAGGHPELKRGRATNAARGYPELKRGRATVAANGYRGSKKGVSPHGNGVLVWGVNA